MSDRLGVPAIETARLILRGHRLDDFPAMRDMWRDPAVTRWIGGKPRPEEETWTKFLRGAGFWAHLGYGFWVIEEKQTGAAVGELGFGDFRRDMAPPPPDMPEFGYAFAAAAQGKGYASEAGLAALSWADANIGGRLFCIISPDNRASIRVAEKCGFSPSGRAVYHGDEIIVFQRG